jgi:Carboxypeptidase regulatory-like domain
VSGRVLQSPAANPVAGASVVFTDLAPKIPDRVVSVSAQSDASGTYTASLPASTYQVRVAPANLPVAQFPPVQGTDQSHDLALPAATSLAHVQGVLVVNGSTPLAGALVSAVDATGTTISGTQISGADGRFALDLPPGPPPFLLQVGPQSGSAGTDVIPTFNAKAAPPAPSTGPITVDLGTLPPTAMLNGKVVDARGAPIASARVLVVNTDALGYTLSRQATTGSDGSFSVVVRQGTYTVQAMPDADPQAPALSAPRPGVIVNSAAIDLTQIQCPDKIRVVGSVLRPDGRPAPAGFRIEATRVPDQVIAGRGTQTATTDATGAFALVVDGGRYRVTITPTAESALPRTIVTVDLPTPRPLVLQIAPPHELVGTVHVAGNPTPAASRGATIDFYALDASGKRSLLIGNAVADPATGQYKVVLPDVSQPAGQ